MDKGTVYVVSPHLLEIKLDMCLMQSASRNMFQTAPMEMKDKFGCLHGNP